jgi:hypothetical protein
MPSRPRVYHRSGIRYDRPRAVAVSAARGLCPRRTLAAFRLGWRQHNLYLLDPERVLALDFDVLVRSVRGTLVE